LLFPNNQTETIMRTQFIIFTMTMVLLACSKSDDPNLAPNEPNIVSPLDGESCLSLKPSLSWEASDPENDELTYTLWIGTSEDKLSIKGDKISNTSYKLNENLKVATKYYWQVEANDGKSGTKSKIASFSTSGEGESGVLPSRPVIIAPIDNTVAGDITFNWQAASDGVGSITYGLFVKYGAASDFTLVQNGLSSTSYTLSYAAGNLSWYVEAKDSRGQISRSAVVSLTIN